MACDGLGDIGGGRHANFSLKQSVFKYHNCGLVSLQCSRVSQTGQGITSTRPSTTTLGGLSVSHNLQLEPSELEGWQPL